jgi:hypothetical protein
MIDEIESISALMPFLVRGKFGYEIVFVDLLSREVFDNAGTKVSDDKLRNGVLELVMGPAYRPPYSNSLAGLEDALSKRNALNSRGINARTEVECKSRNHAAESEERRLRSKEAALCETHKTGTDNYVDQETEVGSQD